MPPLREQKVRNKKKKHISWSGGKFSRGNGRLQRDGTHTHRKKVGRDEWAKTHISRIRSVYVIKRKKKKGRNNVRSKKKQKWIASHHHHHHRHWHWFAIGNQIYFISHFFLLFENKNKTIEKYRVPGRLVSWAHLKWAVGRCLEGTVTTHASHTAPLHEKNVAALLPVISFRHGSSVRRRKRMASWLATFFSFFFLCRFVKAPTKEEMKRIAAWARRGARKKRWPFLFFLHLALRLILWKKTTTTRADCWGIFKWFQPLMAAVEENREKKKFFFFREMTQRCTAGMRWEKTAVVQMSRQ